MSSGLLKNFSTPGNDQHINAFAYQRLGAAQLRDGPGESSRSTVALQTSVVRLGGKQGAWTKVSAPDNSQGWVHMFDLTVAAGTNVGRRQVIGQKCVFVCTAAADDALFALSLSTHLPAQLRSNKLALGNRLDAYLGQSALTLAQLLESLATLAG